MMWMQGLREIATEEGALLCFDEVMTGFRVTKGCAQGHFGVTPDLTTLGKIIGGGLPVGAYGGRRDIMETVAPVGPMYQVGLPSFAFLPVLESRIKNHLCSFCRASGWSYGMCCSQVPCWNACLRLPQQAGNIYVEMLLRLRSAARLVMLRSVCGCSSDQ